MPAPFQLSLSYTEVMTLEGALYAKARSARSSSKERQLYEDLFLKLTNEHRAYLHTAAPGTPSSWAFGGGGRG